MTNDNGKGAKGGLSVNAAEFLTQQIDPGTAWCMSVPGWTVPYSNEAHVLLLAIAGQESGWTYRIQNGNGPAHGHWQMERNGGVRGVLTHPVTYRLATAACVKAGVPASPVSAWGIMATTAGDDLALAFARLLLWTDPNPLPPLWSSADAWNAYIRLWRPGKPRPETWEAIWAEARDAVLLKGNT